MNYRYLASCLFLLVISTGVQAEDSVGLPIPMQQAISQLMALTGADDMAEQMSEMFSQQLIGLIKKNNPAITAGRVNLIQSEIDTQIKNELASGELRSRIHAIYAKHFTLSEIKGLIKFNQSKLGRKANQVTPLLIQESLQLNREWREKMIPVLKQRIERKLAELKDN